MKNILFAFFLLSCIIGFHYPPNSNKDLFIIKIDTIYLTFNEIAKPINKVELTHAAKFNNKYYCFFSEPEHHQHNQIRHFYIISENGIVEHSIPPPSDITEIKYLDLFVKDDTIFLKYDHRRTTYFLNSELLSWIPTDEADDVIYEDNQYYATFLSSGEWGYVTWFKDKQTQKEYELYSYGMFINKIDSTYYITTDNQILQIDDPRKMTPRNPREYYQIAKEHGKGLGSQSLVGAQIIFKDSTLYNEDSDSYTQDVLILTSFKHTNELFHLYFDTIMLQVGRLDNSKFVPIQSIDIDGVFTTYNMGSYRMKIQKDNSQLLIFEPEIPNLYGLIEIKENKIGIRYLKDKIDSINPRKHYK